MALISGAAEFSKQLSVAFDDTNAAAVTSFGPFISPTLEVGPGGSLPVTQYNRYTSAVQTIVADATHTGFAGIVNPLGSGLWFVIEKCSIVDRTAAGAIRAALSADANADGIPVGALSPSQLDGRNGYGTAQGLRGGLWVLGNSALTPPFGATNPIEQNGSPAIFTQVTMIALPILVAPNQAYIVWPITNTHTFDVTVVFRTHEQRPS